MKEDKTFTKVIWFENCKYKAMYYPLDSTVYLEGTTKETKNIRIELDYDVIPFLERVFEETKNDRD